MRWIAKTTMLSIRPFEAKDRASLMNIAADTAFFGEPIEKYLDDRRIFQDYFYAYYTDFEAEHAWVAIAGQKVVGFLTGCFDSKVQISITRRKLLPKVLLRLFSGRYMLGIKTWNYFINQKQAQRSEYCPYVNLQDYPAHLHINVDQNWRGCGIGHHLMQIYLDQLMYAGIVGVHLGTTSENEAACRMYAQFGFKLLDEKPTRQWKAFIDHPAFARAYGLKLPETR
ncbi:MAG: hypothetical protein BGO78_07860 [Chloroflexi bacterium 44-23]|nr:MAG: hypothetical protein BGO78_07860 [Chloroflexi bacterium 44-23]